MTAQKDIQILRTLAARWMEIASLPVMRQRKQVWQSIKELNAIRPAILIETASIRDFVAEDELICTDPFLRNVEKNMRMNIRQFEEVGDDIVLEPYFHLGWLLNFSDYGVNMGVECAEDPEGGHLGIRFEHPVRSVEDLKKLQQRTVTVDRKRSLQYKDMLEEAFGDILPVRLGNASVYEDVPGFSPYLGVNFLYVTYEILALIGNDNFLYWAYDYPEELKRLSRFLMDDKLRLYKWMEDEGLLIPNTDNHWAGPGSYGYCGDLTPPDAPGPAKLSGCWGRTESQESGTLSPEMFNELYLPYIAEGCALFGHVYYGCCERLDDRWEYIRAAIPNLRAVCVAPWNDIFRMGEYIGKDYVYSGKPNPAYLSVRDAEWDVLEKELRQIREASKDCSFELIVRDLYAVKGGVRVLREWVALARKVFGCQAD